MLHVTAVALKSHNNSGTNLSQAFLAKTTMTRNPLHIWNYWECKQMNNVFVAALNPPNLNFSIFTAAVKIEHKVHKMSKC